MLLGRGDRRTTNDRRCSLSRGDRPYDFVVILEGKVAIVEGYQQPG